MEKDTHNEIMLALGNLQGTVITGFDAITKRLDSLNGRVTKHDEQISEIRISDGKQNTKFALIGSVAGAVFGWAISFFK